jgi:hypothetical protein
MSEDRTEPNIFVIAHAEGSNIQNCWIRYTEQEAIALAEELAADLDPNDEDTSIVVEKPSTGGVDDYAERIYTWHPFIKEVEE